LICSVESIIAILIFLKTVYCPVIIYDEISPDVYQSYVIESQNFENFESTFQISENILKLNSSELTASIEKQKDIVENILEKISKDSSYKINVEQQKLIKSILSKVSDKKYSRISVNKFLKIIVKIVDPILSDQRLWRILAEFDKTMVPKVTSYYQEIKPLFSPLTNNPSRSRFFWAEEPRFSEPSMLETPTPDLFAADSVKGDIRDIHVAFDQFKIRMIKIGNQYIGQKREYFFDQYIGVKLTDLKNCQLKKID
jgi:hypothetical protein